MLNGVYVANTNVGQTFTKGKEYKIIGNKIKFDNGTTHNFVYNSLSDLDVYVSGEIISCSHLLDFARPIKPKEILERLDMVEVIGFNTERFNGEYVFLGKTFKRDDDSEYFKITDLDETLDILNLSDARIIKITNKNGNVKWEREPQNSEAVKSLEDIKRKIEELKAEVSVLEGKL